MGTFQGLPGTDKRMCRQPPASHLVRCHSVDCVGRIQECKASREAGGESFQDCNFLTEKSPVHREMIFNNSSHPKRSHSSTPCHRHVPANFQILRIQKKPSLQHSTEVSISHLNHNNHLIFFSKAYQHFHVQLKKKLKANLIIKRTNLCSADGCSVLMRSTQFGEKGF